MLCPNNMTPESSDIVVSTKPLHTNLIAKAESPPSWQDSLIKFVPFIGKTILCAMNAGHYVTTLEQNADFIARDLKESKSQWSRMTDGVINRTA